MRCFLRHALTRAMPLLLGLLLCVAAAPPAAAAAPADRYAAIDAYVRDRMEATRTPGLSYAVVGPEGPVHQRSWGEDGRGERVTVDTPFLWGSVAKPVTATAVMTLVQDGRLDLDDPVVDHLPAFRFGGPAHAGKVTVRHLLEQTSGMPESATFEVTDCYDADCPAPAGRLAALDRIEPTGPPGAAYAYTSANYLVLTAVVEAVTHRPFTQYVRQAVLTPAGMDTAITDKASAREQHLPPGHQMLWGRPAAVADEMDDHGAGYGYLGGTLTDLADFASLQLRGGKTADGDRVLTPASTRLMRTEGTLTAEGGDSPTRTGYGLGWRVGGLKTPLRNAVWHTGATPGYSAMLFLIPERNVALVLQQNLYGLLQDESVMQVGFGAARILADGREPTDDPAASLYYWAVWSSTALAALLLLSTGRAALLVKRGPLEPASRKGVLARTAGWCAVGAVPLLLLVPLAHYGDVLGLLRWIPDAVTALCVAAVAGGTTIVLRLAHAIRSMRRPLGPRSLSGDRHKPAEGGAG
ncbi:serine hydrolase domain-containing protein [Streptomyces sp. WMMB303]|uniref:serine hydrolase domain-containing protein n=1 Tax=Streptomyces sp. WMMB303 TaxID=3034154 RepID=UPI0023EE2427|nr:serine hydrolase domain-containing protein [Streptomyces sp. WMMB303]MDF4248801.1 serine hydrolase [Streptomyces sp. WMMB303]